MLVKYILKDADVYNLLKNVLSCLVFFCFVLSYLIIILSSSYHFIIIIIIIISIIILSNLILSYNILSYLMSTVRSNGATWQNNIVLILSHNDVYRSQTSKKIANNLNRIWSGNLLRDSLYMQFSTKHYHVLLILVTMITVWNAIVSTSGRLFLLWDRTANRWAKTMNTRRWYFHSSVILAAAMQRV